MLYDFNEGKEVFISDYENNLDTLIREDVKVTEKLYITGYYTKSPASSPTYFINSMGIIPNSLTLEILTGVIQNKVHEDLPTVNGQCYDISIIAEFEINGGVRRQTRLDVSVNESNHSEISSGLAEAFTRCVNFNTNNCKFEKVSEIIWVTENLSKRLDAFKNFYEIIRKANSVESTTQTWFIDTKDQVIANASPEIDLSKYVDDEGYFNVCNFTDTMYMIEMELQNVMMAKLYKAPRYYTNNSNNEEK